VRIGTTRALEGRVSGQAQSDVRAVAVPRLTRRSVVGHPVDELAVVGARKTIRGGLCAGGGPRSWAAGNAIRPRAVAGIPPRPGSSPGGAYGTLPADAHL
jgi:hypothetical protein